MSRFLVCLLVVDSTDSAFALRLAHGAQQISSYFSSGDPTAASQIVNAVPINRSEIIGDLASVAQQHNTSALLLYIVGHGVISASGEHFLLHHSDDAPANGIRTAELLSQIFKLDIEHKLVILDSCFAGVVDSEWARRARDLSSEQRASTLTGILASGDFDQQVFIGSFVSLLDRVMARLESTQSLAAEYLSFSDLSNEIEAEQRRDPTAPAPLWLWPRRWDQSAASLCLPNPGYVRVASLTSAAVSDVALDADEYEYWVSRASGRTDDTDPGWYFSGRFEIVKALCAFLESDKALLAVTGGAGTGKSAIIARVVTLADKRFRANHVALLTSIDPQVLPPEDSVHAAVLARNKTTDQIAAALLTRLEAAHLVSTEPGRSVENLLRYVESHDKTLNLVIDGVDEARDPQRLIYELVSALGRLRNPRTRARSARMIVGLRSTRTETALAHGQSPETRQGLLALLEVSSIGQDSETIAVDASEQTVNDIGAYISAVCGTSDRPEQHELVSKIAAIVAPSFLDARLAARRLRDFGLPERHTWPELLDSLGEGTFQLLADDINAVAVERGEPSGLYWVTLAVSAYGLGLGIPGGEIWATIVLRSLTKLNISAPYAFSPDVVLGTRLSGYITEDIEDSRRVFRPSHERLAEGLRSHFSLISEPFIERTLHSSATEWVNDIFVEALVDLLPGSLQHPPYPYVRSYLVEHARIARVLVDERVPSRFLPWDQSLGVAFALESNVRPAQDAEVEVLRTWSIIENQLVDADIRSRFESLAFMLHILGIALVGYEPIITVDYCDARLQTSNVLSGQTAGMLIALSTGKGSADRVAIGDRSSGVISIWDPFLKRRMAVLAAGAPVLTAKHAHQTDDQSLLAVASTDSRITFWETRFGAYQGSISHDVAGVAALDSVLLPGGGLLATGGTDDGQLRLWDTQTKEMIDSTSGSGRIISVCILPDGDEDVLVAFANWRGVARIWKRSSNQFAYIKDTVFQFEKVRIGEASAFVWASDEGTLSGVVWEDSIPSFLTLKTASIESTLLELADNSGVRLVKLSETSAMRLIELKDRAQRKHLPATALLEAKEGEVLVVSSRGGMTVLDRGIQAALSQTAIDETRLTSEYIPISEGSVGQLRSGSGLFEILAITSGEVVASLEAFRPNFQFQALPCMNLEGCFLIIGENELAIWDEELKSLKRLDGVTLTAVRELVSDTGWRISRGRPKGAVGARMLIVGADGEVYLIWCDASSRDVIARKLRDRGRENLPSDGSRTSGLASDDNFESRPVATFVKDYGVVIYEGRNGTLTFIGDDGFTGTAFFSAQTVRRLAWATEDGRLIFRMFESSSTGSSYKEFRWVPESGLSREEYTEHVGGLILRNEIDVTGIDPRDARVSSSTPSPVTSFNQSFAIDSDGLLEITEGSQKLRLVLPSRALQIRLVPSVARLDLGAVAVFTETGVVRLTVRSFT